MNKVSVIIPTHNRRDLIEVTLNNILKQTLKPHEIIVVDDNSTDGTIKFLNEKFKDKILVIKNQGKGPGAARNTGFKASTGDYIKFFDSDDLMTNNYLEEQVNALAHSDKSVIYSPYIFASENEIGDWKLEEDSVLNYYPLPKFKTINKLICRGFFVPIPAMLFTRQIVKRIGPWREDIISSEDLDYLWNIGCIESSLLHNNKCAFIYRKHRLQTTGENLSDIEKNNQRLKILLDIRDKKFLKSEELNSYDKMYLNHIIYLTFKYEGISNRLKSYSLIMCIFSKYILVKNKIQHLKQNSKWNPIYGVINSKEIASNFLTKAII